MKNTEIIHKGHVQYDNLKEVIYASVRNYGEDIAFVIKHQDKDKNLNYEDKTYKMLLDDINAFGTALYAKKLNGKRVAVIGKNRYEWVVAHFANLLGGIVSVPLDKDLQLDELENSLKRSEANAVVFDKKLEPMIAEIKKKGKTKVKEFISMDNLEGYTAFSDMINEGNKSIKEGKKEYIDCEIDSDAMNILLFTSGTTSQSKAVMLSQRNIASNVYALQCAQDVRYKDTNIAFLPFHHIFGSSCIALMLAQGTKNVFPDGLRYIKQNLCEYEVSIFVGVPVLIEAMYKAINKEIEKQGKTKLIKFARAISNFLMKFHIDVRRKLFKQVINSLGGKLRYVVVGGAAMDEVVAKGFYDLGFNIVQGYGLSETSPVIAGENEKHLEFGTVGRLMVTAEVEIDNPDEEGIGEIKVKGPGVFLGYYNMPEETKAVLKKGWFYTGDLGCFTKKGNLKITGRNKNLIVLKNGKKVFPEELETLVNRLDEVLECMVYGMPDEKDKNDITLSIKVVYDKEYIKEHYKDASEEELRTIIWDKIKEINQTFPKYKHIQSMILTDQELIKTTTKKVKRFEEMKLIMENK